MNRAKSIILTTLIALTSSYPALAFDSNSLYDATKDLCESLKPLPSHIQENWLNNHSTPSWKFNSEVFSPVAWRAARETVTDFRALSLSQSATLVLQDVGFNRGLQECFGADERRKEQIRRIIDYADMRGKGIAGLGLVFSGYGFGAFMSRLALVSPFAAQAAGAGTTGMSVYAAYSQLRQQSEIKETFNKTCNDQGLTESECLTGGLKLYVAGLEDRSDTFLALTLILQEDLTAAKKKSQAWMISEEEKSLIDIEIHRLTEALRLAQQSTQLIGTQP